MAGRVLDCLVSHLDLYPTLCELAGVPKPEGLQGISLLLLYIWWKTWHPATSFSILLPKLLE
ncbi:hypothetical protein A7X67_03045 [Clostridium sp. W14A]|uniref:hypothetical protein n=1 Tax=Caproicibacter fermentans TaxID=2576756 RepID=UPI000828C7E1|nr:hypothetical protein A7X67_03045 [Clostridium sp. W14A]